MRKQNSTARDATSVHHHTVSDKYLSRWSADYTHMGSLTHTVSSHIIFLCNSWQPQLSAREGGGNTSLQQTNKRQSGPGHSGVAQIEQLSFIGNISPYSMFAHITINVRFYRLPET